jgi:hypothetical protein
MLKNYGGKINGSVYSFCRCVSGVIRVIYATIILREGGAMNGRDQFQYEQAVRASIKYDLLRFQENFKDKKDLEEAIKIVERKN